MKLPTAFSTGVRFCLYIFPFLTIQNSCFPEHLKKYKNQQPDIGILPMPDHTEHSEMLKQHRGSKQNSLSNPSVTKLTDQSYQFRVSFEKVWNAALRVLIQNYNVILIDKKSGLITTDWDSFYLEDGVYRNKISLLIKRVGWNFVNIMIKDNTEKLRSASSGDIWLPYDSKTKEVNRLVSNMALVLNIKYRAKDKIASGKTSKEIHH